MRVALVGCGRAGSKRAEAIEAHGDVLEIAADLDETRAQRLGERYGCEFTGQWQRATSRETVDAVVVSTDHSALAQVALDALEHGKHVLCEKPLGRTVGEAAAVVDSARSCGVVLKVGFNHRLHPHITAARRLVASGELGRLLFMRAVLGHGGRPGMAGEWRTSHAMAGGGALLDQGIHVIDLFRWFSGELAEVTAWTEGFVWGNGRAPSVEDNVFALLRGTGGTIATMHVSWTQWKNRFHLEAFTEWGYVSVAGLGGESYGPRNLVVGRRRPSGGPPHEEVIEYPPTDDSWIDEWRQFRAAISGRREPPDDGADALATLRVVAAAYASTKSASTVPCGLTDGAGQV